MVGADTAPLRDLEARAARRLDQATLGAVEGGGGSKAARVARLVDVYLAETALEAGLRPAEFEELARAVPAHARPADDALYRAVDTYLKAHPSTAKEERKSLARLIDARKLTVEAAAHAVQNERMSVRAVVQVLFSEHGKLNRLAELSASFSGQRSPSPSPNPALELPGRCPSKREVLAQHQEVRRLRDDVARLQVRQSACLEFSSPHMYTNFGGAPTDAETYVCSMVQVQCNALQA
ncbi:Phototropic-responsive NPH3 family protein [Zea mays]|uniref:Phototropic-responsive NPH3 family protein n=1 Tax=Zea mays TaxID=4577 RepID=A0A1D6L0B7_MAIZE|nr:Phototropic-responsive NPH3 family protein [Zea mays]